MRVLVTGASGFIGSIVCRKLVADGHGVIAGVRPTSDFRRLADLLGKVTICKGGWPVENPTAIVHCAWDGTRGGGRDDARRQFSNVEATTSLVMSAAEHGVSRFVGIGSYAEGLEPRSLYGAAKLTAGELALALARQRGMSAAWVRLYSVYGPHDLPEALISRVIRAFRAGQNFPLEGDGAHYWDYLFETDAAEGIARLVCDPAICGRYDLAWGTSDQLIDYLYHIRRLMNPTLAIILSPGRSRSVVAWDAQILHAALKWRPSVDVAEGFKRTIAELPA